MPEQPTWRQVIQKEAEAAGVPPALAFAIIEQESSGRPDAVGQEVPGQGRALGFFQLMPATAQGLGVNPGDPYQNIQGGIKLLSQLHERYGSDVPAIVAAYHGGTDLAQHGPKTQQYVRDVLGRLQKAEPGAPAAPEATMKEVKAPSQPEKPATFLEGYPRTQTAVRLGLQALPIAGAIGGGMLGGPVGAGLLAGAGEGLKEAAKSAAGFAPPSTLAEQVQNAAMVGGSTAALGGVGKVIPGAAVRVLASPAGRAATGAAAGGVAGYELTGSPYGAAAGALGGAGLVMGGGGAVPEYLLHGRRGALLGALLRQAEKKGAVGALDETLGTKVAPAAMSLEEELLKRATAQQGVEIPRNLVLTPEEFARLDQLRQAMKPGGSAIGAAYQRFGQGGVRSCRQETPS